MARGKQRAPTLKRSERAAAIDERLARAIPAPHLELHFEEPWQLLVAVMLAAQSTDRTVNTVMPPLLRRWSNPTALARAPQVEVEQAVFSTGFFRNKAKSIREMSQALLDRFGGVVPRTLEELVELRGVARKTANVVLGAAYGVVSGFVVDVHVTRLASRLRLSRHADPEKIERDLCKLFPRDQWIQIGHRLVLFGRHLCTARAPRCAQCPINEVCPVREAEPEGSWLSRADAVALEMESRGSSFHPADARMRLANRVPTPMKKP